MSILSSIGNAIEHPITAFKNVENRLANTDQYKIGAGGLPTWDNLKYAITPQTAHAQGTTPGLDYSTPSWQAAGWPDKATADSYWNAGYHGDAAGLQSWLVQQDALAKDQANQKNNGGSNGGGNSNPYAALYNHVTDPFGNVWDMGTPQGQAGYAQATQDYQNNIGYGQQINQFQNVTVPRMQEDINTARGNLGNQRQAYQQQYYGFFGNQPGQEGYNPDYAQQLGEYGTNVQNLNLGHNQGNLGIMNHFSSMAPGVYQSAEGDNIGMNNTLYGQGQNSLAAQRQQNVNQFSGINNQLDTSERNINRQAQDLTTQQQLIPQQYQIASNQAIGQAKMQAANLAAFNKIQPADWNSMPTVSHQGIDIGNVLNAFQNGGGNQNTSSNNYFGTNPAVISQANQLQGIQNGSNPNLTYTQKQQLGLV